MPPKSIKTYNSYLFFLLIVSFTALCFFYYDELWSNLGVQIVKPIFNDSRVITAGAESYYEGFDPLVNNPAMWSKNAMNYPRVWHVLFHFGLNQSHTNIMGYLMLTFYLSALFILLRTSNDVLANFLITCCAISPAAMLGVERGNIDLVIFLMATLSAVYANRKPLLAATILIVSCILKIFPVFCLPVLLSQSTRKKAIQIFAISAATCIAYFLFTYKDLILISESTPRAGDLSYGRNVFATRLKGNIPLNYSTYVDIFFALLFAVASFFSYLVSRNILTFSQKELAQVEGKEFFLTGSLIYTGTFFIGNNWDYRLVFLILMIPFLASVLRTIPGHTVRSLAKILITLTLMSFWYLFWAKRLEDHLPARIALYCLDELVDWLIYILSLSFIFKFISLGVKKNEFYK